MLSSKLRDILIPIFHSPYNLSLLSQNTVYNLSKNTIISQKALYICSLHILSFNLSLYLIQYVIKIRNPDSPSEFHTRSCFFLLPNEGVEVT